MSLVPSSCSSSGCESDRVTLRRPSTAMTGAAFDLERALANERVSARGLPRTCHQRLAPEESDATPWSRRPRRNGGASPAQPRSRTMCSPRSDRSVLGRELGSETRSKGWSRPWRRSGCPRTRNLFCRWTEPGTGRSLEPVIPWPAVIGGGRRGHCLLLQAHHLPTEAWGRGMPSVPLITKRGMHRTNLVALSGETTPRQRSAPQRRCQRLAKRRPAATATQARRSAIRPSRYERASSSRHPVRRSWR